MKRNLLLLTLISSSIWIAACTTPAPQNANTPSNTAKPGANGTTPVAVHGVPGGPPSQPSGGPQFGTPIDTTRLDAMIEKAEQGHAAKPNDARYTKALADAYFARAEALKDAQQYRSALGDYRRTLKYDASNVPAREMRDQIIAIMQSMHREVPEEGQEPPAMHKQ
jgi:tetratricopeptide (TPR) repeat protein